MLQSNNHKVVSLAERRRDLKPQRDYFYSQTTSFYQRCAALFDDLWPDHVDASVRLATEIAPYLRSRGVRRILDASCGVGHDIASFRNLGFSVDGADVSERMLRSAKERLRGATGSDAELRLCDARELTSGFDYGAYDAVIFRGNTLSNIKPSEYQRLFLELAGVVRSRGLVLIDYREGERHFRARKRIELRGFQLDRQRRLLGLAWYWYRHGNYLGDTFRVTASVLQLSLSNPPLASRHLTIRSHYVPEGLIRPALSEAGLRVVHERKSCGGLPYLKTVIAERTA